MLKATSVNSNGIKAIHAFLANNHKKGGNHFTTDMLRAWAADAEFQLSEGNSATIEIKSWDAISGHTETFTVPDEGLNFVEVWKAWIDGCEDDAVLFNVPECDSVDIAEAGAAALGVEISEALNVQRV